MNGYILHEDSQRVIIATGFESPSDNRKTGDMIQVWILVRAMDPVRAIKEGLDRLICGSCVHRGHEENGRFGVGRSCYVNAGQAPLGIWRAWKAGAYLPLPSVSVFEGRRVRFGAYGDPVHMPLSLALAIAGVASGHTGYTHQWRRPSLQGWKGLVMASVDTTAELLIARSMGWSTFRVSPDLDHHSMETLCASDRDGTPCIDCQLCAGSGLRSPAVRSVWIPVHGTGRGHFINRSESGVIA
ncbi:MAG: hypothetical protein EBT13_17730 [Rhodobacteraceae bacterium]|nr:hypothetical protein [Paracoccaceae bacterium]